MPNMALSHSLALQGLGVRILPELCKTDDGSGLRGWKKSCSDSDCRCSSNDWASKVGIMPGPERFAIASWCATSTDFPELQVKSEPQCVPSLSTACERRNSDFGGRRSQVISTCWTVMASLPIGRGFVELASGVRRAGLAFDLHWDASDS